MSKLPEKDNLPGNYPRFSSISNHNEASTNQSTRLSTGFRGDNSFLGIGRKTEGLSATNRTNDDDIASQQSCMIDENSVNEIISKELHSERELVLNYVNASLNDNASYVKETCKQLKEDQDKGRSFADQEITLLNQLMNKMKDSFRGELENLNVRLTQLVKDQNIVYEQNLQKLSDRFIAFENKNNASNMHQADDPELVKLNREIEGIRANLQQIIQTSESKKQVDQSQQISDLNSEIQAMKTSISSFKQDWEPKAQDIHESTKQMLLNAVGQDKQIDKQIEDIQRYMFGFQKVFQHKLSITNDDLKLFMDSQDSFKKNTPFSFGGDMNIVQTEPISTLGTSYSAEFEVHDGNKLFMKKKEVINKPAVFPESTNTTTTKQGLQPSSYTNIASQISANPGNPSSGRNSLNADYYNIYNDGVRTQPSVSSKAPFMEASSQNPKKKKRIFGEDSQSISNNWGNQSMRTLEQKNQMPFQYGPTGQTHFQSTETDQVQYETIVSNKDSLQESQEGEVNPAALESKLSVTVNDSNVNIFEEESNHSGSDQESTYSNFRLKDTMNFVQREFASTSGQSHQEKSLTSVDPLQKRPSLTNNNSNSQNPFAPLPNKNPQFSQEANNNTAFTDKNTNYPLSIPSYTPSTQQYSSQEAVNVQIPATKKNSPFEYSCQDKLQFQQLKTIVESELEQSQKPSEIQNVTKIDNFMSKSKGSLGKQLISGQTLNFMIASKGKKADNPLEHTYNEETSKLNGVALNDFAGDFHPKWGYDSQVSESSFKEEIEYQLDEEGFLLDQNGQILLDDNGEKIKLSEDHIRYLQQNQMIQDA